MACAISHLSIVTPMMLWIVLHFQDFKQHKHLFIAYDRSPLNEQVPNGDILNPLLLPSCNRGLTHLRLNAIYGYGCKKSLIMIVG